MKEDNEDGPRFFIPPVTDSAKEQSKKRRRTIITIPQCERLLTEVRQAHRSHWRPNDFYHTLASYRHLKVGDLIHVTTSDQSAQFAGEPTPYEAYSSNIAALDREIPRAEGIIRRIAQLQTREEDANRYLSLVHDMENLIKNNQKSIKFHELNELVSRMSSKPQRGPLELVLDKKKLSINTLFDTVDSIYRSDSLNNSKSRPIPESFRPFVVDYALYIISYADMYVENDKLDVMFQHTKQYLTNEDEMKSARETVRRLQAKYQDEEGYLEFISKYTTLMDTITDFGDEYDYESIQQVRHDVEHEFDELTSTYEVINDAFHKVKENYNSTFVLKPIYRGLITTVLETLVQPSSDSRPHYVPMKNRHPDIELSMELFGPELARYVDCKLAAREHGVNGENKTFGAINNLASLEMGAMIDLDAAIHRLPNQN